MTFFKGLRRTLSLPLFGLSLTIIGCGGESVSNTETAVNQQLIFSDYQATVNPIFDLDIDGRTCSSSGCHNIGNGSGGGLKLYSNATPDSFEMDFNYRVAQSLSNLTTPSQSKLLLEPLAGTFSITGSHAGGDIFDSVNDVNYLAILAWISNPEEITDSEGTP
ncbi:hypothetical protein [Litoribacillus peritrichatus]|uniref:Cytochrome c domain-containing protein n=1 Tax=Litoribacillus peritrichatus TaxID=718191 RepID=A0ABP7N5U1_9GAMM